MVTNDVTVNDRRRREYDKSSYLRKYRMGKAKIAITLDEDTLQRVDRLISNQVFPNRSRAIAEAIEEKLERIERSRLARECAKLDPKFEKAMAEEGLSEDAAAWPEY
jgi:Arc/MetJ-type ribon-helix-helix transcriptional regulator